MYKTEYINLNNTDSNLLEHAVSIKRKFRPRKKKRKARIEISQMIVKFKIQQKWVCGTAEITENFDAKKVCEKM